jgi:hypothetical protein
MEKTMYCPHCGTKAASNQVRFCYECGAEIAVPAGRQSEPGSQQTGQETTGPAQQIWCGTSPGRGPAGPSTALRTVLMAAGLVVLVPVILIAGLALLGLAVHALPVIALGLLVYWALSRRQRWSGARL